jgi:hypothetical protein
MAGTQSDLRQNAQFAYDQAVSAGADPGVIAKLKAELEARKADERRAMGK